MRTLYTTQRLLLKVLDERSANDVLNFYNLNRDYFETWEPERVPGFYTLDFQKMNLNYEYDLIKQNQMLRLWICEKSAPDIIVGSISFYNFIRGSMLSCQTGYKVDHYCVGRGIATEALDAAIDIIFTQYHFHRIEALVHPDNKPSQRVMEKLNFMYEGLAHKSVRLDGVWCDHLRYVLINLAD